jgi:transcriptional regulator with XRE-family HTH domain
MDTINSRLETVRKHFGLSQTKFAKAIGVTSQLVNKIEAEAARLTEANIRLVCLTFGVNQTWLREGIGKMLDDDAIFSDSENRLIELFRRLSHRARKMLIEYAEKLLADETQLRGSPQSESEESEEKRGAV